MDSQRLLLSVAPLFHFVQSIFTKRVTKERIATVAQAREGTLEVIRNRLKRNAQDGGKMMLQAFGMVLVVIQCKMI